MSMRARRLWSPAAAEGSVPGWPVDVSLVWRAILLHLASVCPLGVPVKVQPRGISSKAPPKWNEGTKGYRENLGPIRIQAAPLLTFPRTTTAAISSGSLPGARHPLLKHQFGRLQHR
ncbi:unnamed protein product [Arctogadus glacialis]